MFDQLFVAKLGDLFATGRSEGEALEALQRGFSRGIDPRGETPKLSALRWEASRSFVQTAEIEPGECYLRLQALGVKEESGAPNV